MKPIKPWAKYTAAMLLLAGGVGGSVWYNQFWQPMMNSETVYLATSNLPAGTLITSSDWSVASMNKSHVSPGAITNWQTLTGLYTSEAMSANQQFTAQDTEDDPYVITPGTEDVPISPSWIASVSPTLRQGDYVEIIPIAEQGGTPLVGNTNEALNHLLVLSVHTSQNTEVVNASNSGPQTVGAINNGTGTPNIVDVKMTTVQADLLQQYVQAKDQLVIVGVTPPRSVDTTTAKTINAALAGSTATINASNGMYP